MKRLSAVLTTLLATAFYVLWPAYSGYEIRNALEAKDVAALTERIDFASVKESLRPATTTEAERVLKEQLSKAGKTAGLLADEIAKRALPRLVDRSLEALLTPENIIRIHAQGGAFKEGLASAVTDQLGRSGGIAGLGTLLQGGSGAPAGDKPSTLGGLIDKIGKAVGAGENPVTTTGALPVKSAVRTVGSDDAPRAAELAPGKTSYGLANIKSAGLAGPTTVFVSVAKDPSAKEADLTAEMTFTGTGWKLSAIRPHL